MTATFLPRIGVDRDRANLIAAIRGAIKINENRRTGLHGAEDTEAVRLRAALLSELSRLQRIHSRPAVQVELEVGR